MSTEKSEMCSSYWLTE